MKKYLRIFAFCSLLTVPAGAFAIIPALVSLATYFTADALFVNSLAASTIAVGAVVGFVHFKDPAAAAPTITVQLAPLAKAITPTGWTAPAAGSSQPTPPTTGAPPVGSYSISCAGQPGGVCTGSSVAGVASVYFGIRGYGESISSSTASSFTFLNYLSGTNSTIQVTVTQNCAGGYTVSGSTCALTNATLVSKPDSATRCTFNRVGNALAPDARETGCASLPAGVNYSGNSVSVTSSDGKVQTVTIDTVTGRAEVTTVTPTGDGGSVKTTNNFTSPSAGGGDGTGVLSSGNTTGNFSGTGVAADTPAGTGTSTCGGAGQPACTVKVDEAGTPSDGSLSTQKSEFDAAVASKITQIEGSAARTSLGLSLSINWPTATCENPTVAIPRGLGTLSVDLCSKAGEIAQFMDFIFSTLAAMYLFSLGVGAFKGS